MPRTLLPAGLLAFLCLACGSPEGGKAEPSGFAGLKAEFLAKLQKAKAAEDKTKVFDEYGPRFGKLAAEAKGPEAPEAIAFLLELSIAGRNAALREQATSLIRKGHVKEASANAFLPILTALADEENVALLSEILKDNPDRLTRARAVKALVKANHSLARQAADITGASAAQARASLTRGRGEAFVKYLGAGPDEFVKRANASRGLLAREYKDAFPDLSIGKPIPEVVSKDLEGKEVKLSDHKGKVIVIDIWATWCPPCVAMIPHELALANRLRDRPFALIGISADDSPEVVKEFMKRKEMPWVHWHNGPSGGIIDDWEVQSYPTILVIDHKGIIRFKDVRDEEMDEAVEKLLKEMEAGK